MKFVRPLSDLGSEIRSRSEKIHFGIASIDRKLRGFRVGEFGIIAGLPHQGKSLIAQTMVYNNRAVPMLWVSPDESRAKVLAQFAAVALGRSYQDDFEPILESRESDGETPTDEALDLTDEITETITREYPLLTVIGGQYLSIADLGVAVDEAHEVTGHKPKMLVFDYMSQLRLPPGFDTPNGKPDALKEFASRTEVGVIAIHQIRKLYNPFDALSPNPGMLSYGGEQQAFQIVWCAREALIDPSAGGPPEDRQPRVRVFVLKNKNGKTQMDGVDCAIDPVTGLVEEWSERHTRRRRGFDRLYGS